MKEEFLVEKRLEMIKSSLVQLNDAAYKFFMANSQNDQRNLAPWPAVITWHGDRKKKWLSHLASAMRLSQLPLS